MRFFPRSWTPRTSVVDHSKLLCPYKYCWVARSRDPTRIYWFKIVTRRSIRTKRPWPARVCGFEARVARFSRKQRGLLAAKPIVKLFSCDIRREQRTLAFSVRNMRCRLSQRTSVREPIGDNQTWPCFFARANLPPDEIFTLMFIHVNHAVTCLSRSRSTDCGTIRTASAP